MVRNDDLGFSRRDWRQAVEEPADLNRERVGQCIKPARRDAILRGFVFLDLLKGDAGQGG